MLSFAILLLIIYTEAVAIRVDTIAAITKSVLERFQSTCFFVLAFKDYQGLQILQDIQLFKTFSTRNFVAATTVSNSTEKIYEVSGCGLGFMTLIMNLRNRDAVHTHLKMISGVTLSSRRWLIFLNDETKVEEFFTDIYIPFDCVFLVAEPLGDLKMTLTEVYHINSTMPLQRDIVANCSFVEGCNWSSVPLNQRRRNLGGLAFKGTFITGEPEIYFINNEDKKTMQVSGVLGDIWNELQERLNFTLEYHIILNGSSNRSKTGWDTVLRSIQKKDIDVGMNFFYMHEHRLNFVDFLSPIRFDKGIAVIKQLNLTDSNFADVLLLPFRPSLWLSIVAAMLMLAICLTVTWHICNYFCDEDPIDFTFYNSIHYVFGIFCQQGHSTSPKCWTCRLVYLTCYVTAVVLFVAYSATFVSYLTVNKPKLPFTDYEGMIKDGTYKLGVTKSSDNEAYFKNSSYPLLREVYKKLVAPYEDQLPVNGIDGLRRVCESAKYCYSTHLETIRALARNLSCQVVALPQTSFPDTASVIIGKNSPFKRIFNYNIQQLRSAGILNRLNNLYNPTNMKEIPQTPEIFVNLEHVKIFFVILTTGIFLSIVILLIEIVYHRKKSDRPLAFID